MSRRGAGSAIRHGFTLVEVLCGLALLSMTMLVAFTWMRDAGRLLAATAEAQRRAAVRVALVDLLHDDLVTATAADGTSWRVDEEAGALHLPRCLNQSQVRQPGFQDITWQFDGEGGRLFRTSRSVDADTPPLVRVLADGLAAWRFEAEDGMLFATWRHAGTAHETRLRLWSPRQR